MELNVNRERYWTVLALNMAHTVGQVYRFKLWRLELQNYQYIQYSCPVRIVVHLLVKFPPKLEISVTSAKFGKELAYLPSAAILFILFLEQKLWKLPWYFISFWPNFGSCLTKFKFWGKLYPWGPHWGCARLCAGPKFLIFRSQIFSLHLKFFLTEWLTNLHASFLK